MGGTKLLKTMRLLGGAVNSRPFFDKFDEARGTFSPPMRKPMRERLPAEPVTEFFLNLRAGYFNLRVAWFVGVLAAALRMRPHKGVNR